MSYTSNDETIATVTASGLITAVAPGKTTITIVDEGSEAVKGKALTVNVTVAGSAIIEGDIIIQAGTLPYGYYVDDQNTFSKYTYSSSDWINSANVFLVDASQHVVTIPSGVKVTKAVLYAVNDNNTAAKGKITELAGKTFSIDLPSRKNDTAFAVATADNISVTGELTFTVTYKSGVKLALTVTEEATGIQTVSSKATDTVKAVKFMKDGKLVIEKNGKLFNMAGIEVVK